VTRATRNLRKTLDSVAENNETAAFDLMRAVEKLGDEVLRQLAQYHPPAQPGRP
jgi:hypothetical protein